jgi:hypothetical protein|tara:strand:+ start:304 stop:585 length:282 start_codon:yes stop_codon:yes gene_type:complete
MKKIDKFGLQLLAGFMFVIFFISISYMAFAEDCKYVQKITMDENNVILSSVTEYVCVQSKPVVVLEPIVTNVTKVKRPRPISFTQIRNRALGY